MNKILIISAHPDDETIGAGGALLKHLSNGDSLYWIIVTSMTSKNYKKDAIKKRKIEIDKVSKFFKFKKTFLLNYPTAELTGNNMPELVSRIGKIFTEIQPNIVYILNRSDAHSDHRIVFDAAYSCTKSFRYPSIKEVLMYECLSETEFAQPFSDKVFIPNYFINITNFFEKKIEALKIYKSEFGKPPFPRSFENVTALATYRGCTAGFQYAEAFQLLIKREY